VSRFSISSGAAHFIAYDHEAYRDNRTNFFIKSHLPQDPTWQLLYYPVSITDFTEGYYSI